MATYEVVSHVTVKDGNGVAVPGVGFKHVWSGLSKEQVLKIESTMVGYLKQLAKAAEMRIKGQIPEPDTSTGPQDYEVLTECFVLKDGKEWAAMSFRLPNQNPVYLVIMSNLYTQAIGRIPPRINAKMTITQN